MQLGPTPPIEFTKIDRMHHFTLSSEGYFQVVYKEGQVERIDVIFQKTGLTDFFKRSEGKKLKIVSLGSGASPELAVIEKYAKKFLFTYEYYALDLFGDVFRKLFPRRESKNKSASFHIVDSSDVESIRSEIPVLEDDTVDVTLLLQPNLEEIPYPFWKMYLDVIPRISKTDGMIVSSFLLHAEVIKFTEYTNAASVKRIYKEVLCGQTEVPEKYLFGSPHLWYASLLLQPDARTYVCDSFGRDTSELYQLFTRIVAAPIGDCYSLESLEEISEEDITAKLEKAKELSLRLRKSAQTDRRNWKPPYQFFAYANQSWAQDLMKYKW